MTRRRARAPEQRARSCSSGPPSRVQPTRGSRPSIAPGRRAPLRHRRRRRDEHDRQRGRVESTTRCCRQRPLQVARRRSSPQRHRASTSDACRRRRALERTANVGTPASVAAARTRSTAEPRPRRRRISADADLARRRRCGDATARICRTAPSRRARKVLDDAVGSAAGSHRSTSVQSNVGRPSEIVGRRRSARALEPRGTTRRGLRRDRRPPAARPRRRRAVVAGGRQPRRHAGANSQRRASRLAQELAGRRRRQLTSVEFGARDHRARAARRRRAPARSPRGGSTADRRRGADVLAVEPTGCRGSPCDGRSS